MQTKVRQEDIALQNLVRQSFETFLPKVSVRRRRDRWAVVFEPLFQGYLFVRLNLEQQNTAPLRSTRGVVGLVSFGGVPQPISTALIQSLMDMQSFSNEAIDPMTVFNPGDSVELVDGPMVGLKGIFKARNSRERVIVLFDIMGVEARLSVSPDELAMSI